MIHNQKTNRKIECNLSIVVWLVIFVRHCYMKRKNYTPEAYAFAQRKSQLNMKSMNSLHAQPHMLLHKFNAYIIIFDQVLELQNPRSVRRSITKRM